MHRKKVKKNFFGKNFFFQKKHFILGLKFEWNLSVNTDRSGTDYCWLYCAFRLAQYLNKFWSVSKNLDQPKLFWDGTCSWTRQILIIFRNIFDKQLIDFHTLCSISFEATEVGSNFKISLSLRFCSLVILSLLTASASMNL